MKSRFKPKYSIKKGDKVVVISGADKDRKTPRTVLSVIPDEKSPKVLVEGVNIKTKHLKPNAQTPQGSIIQQEAPISLSNVQIWDAKAAGPTKIKRERQDGKAIRKSKKTGEIIK
ncbi:MAG: 50S ribosomal protein L24 [Chitinophagaceae bacterium]|nr:50S ribosomal protein L24 [Chitinophagaceae bacterium]HMN33428.1 50S ribosomal protein L24 [Chitinophagaceae bacterium]